MDDIEIDLVVVTKDGYPKLIKCVKHLCLNRKKPKNLIIIDSSQKPGGEFQKETAKLAEKAGIRLKYHKISHKGVGYSRNLGLRNVQSKYFAFIDDDEYAPKFWLERVARLFGTRDDIQVLAGPKIPSNGKNYWHRVWRSLSEKEFNYIGRVETIPSGNSAYRTNFLKRHNLKFDERFIQCSEDQAFSIELKKHKANILFHKGLWIKHDVRKSTTAIIKQWFYYGANKHLYQKLYLGSGSLSEPSKIWPSLVNFRRTFPYVGNLRHIETIPGLVLLNFAFLVGYLSSFVGVNIQKKSRDKKEIRKLGRKRPLMAGFLLTTLSCFFSIGFVELISSRLENKVLQQAVLDWRNKDSEIVGCFQLSEELGIEPIWGKCGYPEIASYQERKDTNVLGESSLEECRILIIGDSNTKRGEFDRLLEDNLNKIYEEEGKKFRVIKVGVESYNTRQEVELLRNKVNRSNPNMVIMQFTLNDFWFSPVVLRMGERIVYFSSRGEKSYESNNFLFKHSSVYRLLTLKKLLIDKEPLTELEKEEIFPWKDKLSSMERNLDNFKEVLAKNAVSEAVVVVYPNFGDSQLDRERNAILELLNKKGIDSIDLLPLTAPYGGPRHFQYVEYGQVDMVHPQRSFDGLVAEALTKYVAGVVVK